MSKKLLLTQPLRAALVVLTIGLFGCNNLSDVANSSSTTTVTSADLDNYLPKVVATTSVLCDLTKQIAQQTINLTCLISPDADPRFYQPKPKDRKAIEQAQLILYNGYNFEPGLIKLIKTSKKRVPKIAVGQRAVPQPLQFQEDGDTVPDPYLWHNAKNGIRMVEIISSNLGKVVPENASVYRSNAQKIKSELTQLDTWIKSRIASVPANQRELVTTDDAMGYYAKAYGLSYAGVLEGISTKERPTDARVQSLVKYIKQARVPTLFTETTNNPNLIKGVAKEANVKVSERELFADNLGASGSEGNTYQKMMVANTRTIVEGLGGTYLIFEPKASK